MQTNYIIQLNSSFRHFADDEKITPFHISLYMALFQKWNSIKFRNPISIARDEIMYLSKIGSANTYIKCLKELNQWGYIKYVPSHNYHVGSKIYMYTFNKTSQTTSDKTTNNASDIFSDKTTDKDSAQELRPYNKPDKINTNNSKKGKEIKTTSFHKPSIEELKDYFLSKVQQVSEADKFFNYFESNGWLIGGKTPMKNWKAAANNWILNAQKFSSRNQQQTSESKHPAGKLHTEINKNYNEPL